MRLNFTPFLLAAGFAIVLLAQVPAQAQTISTVAGGGSNASMPATSHAMAPVGVAFDANGNYYITSVIDGSVFKVDPSGMLTSIAGNGATTVLTDGALASSGRFNSPDGIVVDAAGNIYLSDYDGNKVWKIGTDGIVTTFAGTGTAGSLGDGGPAGSAQLNLPEGLGIDVAGNIYVAEIGGNRIRKITPGGTISTIAGTGVQGYSGDSGPAISAKLSGPAGVAVDAAGNFYIADQGNHVVRKITTDGIIHTIAGTGANGFSGDGGPATSAMLNDPEDVVIDGQNNLYITFITTNRVRKVAADGTITTIAGTGVLGYNGDGVPAVGAEFGNPTGLALDAAGNIYIADENNRRLREITLSGTILTVAGNGTFYSGAGRTATSAALFSPQSVSVDHSGNIYFPDKNAVLKVDAGGHLSLFAGIGLAGFSGDGGPATNAGVNNPFGVYADAAGNVYIGTSGDFRVRKVSPSGIITTFAGNGTNGYTGDGGPATSASIGHAQGIAGDAAGNIYITDFDHGVVRKVTPAGIISTFAGTGTPGYSGDNGPATSAQLGAPNGICVDAAGNVYVADDAPNSVRKITPAGIITTVAGSGDTNTGDTGDGGPATAALFGDIEGLTCDAIGNLYIVDGSNNRVRRVDASTGIISAFAGNGTQGFAGDNGPALAAEFNGPWAASMDGQGNVYVGDAQNQRVRKITIPYTLPSVNTSITQTINGTLSADVNDNSFHRIVTVTPTGGANALGGSVVFGLSFDPSIQLFNGHPYVTRHYDITPAANAATSQAMVTLYFAQSEFDAYNNYVSANHLGLPVLPVNAADVTDMSNITIMQFHGTGTAPANYTGGAELITPTVSFDNANNWWAISFPVNGFSGFFLTSGTVPLPLHLLSFSGLLQGSSVTLDWKTADETGTRLFNVERSSNAKDFTFIGQVVAKDVAGPNSYQYVDQSVGAGVWYYRLKMQDIDGKFTYSPVISVNVGATFQGMLLYPNPVADRLFVQLQSTQTEKTVARLVDMQGRTLQQQEITLCNGVTSFVFDTRSLARGTYFISVGGSRPQIRQLIKP